MDNLRLVIESDPRPATNAVGQVNTALNSMDQLAARVANSISQHFQAMAREIQQAIRMINTSLGGLTAQSSGLVNQYGRPIASSQPIAGIPLAIGPVTRSVNNIPPITQITGRAERNLSPERLQAIEVRTAAVNARLAEQAAADKRASDATQTFPGAQPAISTAPAVSPQTYSTPILGPTSAPRKSTSMSSPPSTAPSSPIPPSR